MAIPFGMDGLLRLLHGSATARKRVLTIGLVTGAIASFHFLWQYTLTGDALTNPYTLWWEYDKIGFGLHYGPGEMVHTLKQSWFNTHHSLILVGRDLFGWGQISWLLPLLGLWKLRRRRKVWLLTSVFPSLVLVYMAYWVSGPRYFYEGIYSLTLLSAAGIAWLASWFSLPEEIVLISPRLRRWIVFGLLGLGIALSAVFYTPARLQAIHARYGFERSPLKSFQSAAYVSKTPALIIVHADNWKQYGVFLHLQDPLLTSPFIFYYASSSNVPVSDLASHFPDRNIYHYDPDTPTQLMSDWPER